MPKVTALMPLFNGRDFIQESLKSVQQQTFTDWEFIIVNDFGSDDGCADVVRQFAEKDQRIILIQAEERIGLAASLNAGLAAAKGEYVARVDVDDPSEPERFEKQVRFMDAHPDVSLCSVWQRSVTPQSSYVQEVACEAQELKAAMLFGCEISHCGVMLRKKDFDAHGWRYDTTYLGEDYELWTRMLMEGAVIVNIPEVLVSHRWGFGNISIAKGERLRAEVCSLSARMLKKMGVETERYSSYLFSGWRARPEQYARKNTALFLQQGYQLVQEILEKNKSAAYCDQNALRKVLFQRWNWIRESCGLKFHNYSYGQFFHIEVTPMVSVVLPTFNSAKEISQAIDCVLDQTYTDWELLVINDFDSSDGTAELVQMYACYDPRIRLIQADTRLGLARSLNLGMREAKGKYIARLDADDTSKPERFAKQVAYLEAHPEVGICGTWQHHYGKDIDWVHKAAPDPKVQQCRLLFWCDLCHSTLMLRRDVFIEHDLFYDPNAQAEDFELWTRAMEYMEIANIPEILGGYSEGTGITSGKIQLLAEESGRITSRTVKRILNIDIPPDEQYLLNGWNNPLFNETPNREKELERIKEIFIEIWKRNQTVHFFDSQELLQALAGKWYWIKDKIDWKCLDYTHIKCIDHIFDNRYKPSLFKRYKVFKEDNPQISTRLKKIIKRIFRIPAHFTRRVVKSLLKDSIEEINCRIEEWSWDRYQRLQRQMDARIWKAEKISRKNLSLLSRLNFEEHLVPLQNGEKIRVVFIFQVASFWPSLDSFYQAIQCDKRYDVKLICYDEDIDSTIKTDNARQYLNSNQIDFIPYEDFNIDEYRPHIVVLQTPYDTNRCYKYQTLNLKSKGYRVLYVPYGIEIASTNHAKEAHFKTSVVTECWRMYTFSNAMKADYVQYCANYASVRVVGLPKFDALFYPERFPLSDEIRERKANRKLVLWKVHFPKVIWENGKRTLVTPYINEYINFAKKIEQNEDLFFIFMPHPRFKEFNDDAGVKSQLEQLVHILSRAENVFIDDGDDYRNSLVNADCIIVDRSAVMVEAGSVGVPVLYMYNPDYREPLTDAIQPLISSYYQGTSCTDMEFFLSMCRRGEDPRKQEREAAFQICIPYFDGKCGERIKEDIILSLEEEKRSCLPAKLMQQNAQLEGRIAKLEQSLQALAAEQSTALLERSEQKEQELFSRMDKSVERWTWDRYCRTKREHISLMWNILYEMDSEKMRKIVSTSAVYDVPFYWNNRYGSINSAQRILGQIFNWLPHESVVDIGCGTGTWLWTAQMFGAKEILGVDGDYVPEPLLMIPSDCFLATDLEQPLILPRRFDMAMSLEVAEHLSPEAADGYVESLCKASDIILFSAAHPGQGGDGHINEQPMEYWIEKYTAHGYRPVEIRHFFKDDKNIEFWYRDNLILFACQNKFADIAAQIGKANF